MSAPRRDGFQIFLMVACVALMILVVLLAVENRRLKAELIASYESLPTEALAPGERVGAFDVADASGGISTVDPAASPTGTLLLLFSTECPACDRTIPLWIDLFAGANDPTAPRKVGVRLDRPAESEESPGLVAAAFPFPVYSVTDRGIGDDLRRIPFIPAAVLLDSSGTVVETWYGAPDEDDLEALGSARLP